MTRAVSMMRTGRWKQLGIALVAATVLLGGCGKRTDDTGSSGQGTPQFNANGEIVSGAGVGEPGLGAAVGANLTVRVTSDVTTLPTGGTDIATITAFVTNERNQAVADQAVDISADAGVLQGISSTTDNNGEASATLSLAQDYRNREITVTVDAGRATGTSFIRATGTRFEFAVEGADTGGGLADGDADVDGTAASSVVADPGTLVVTLLAGNDSPIGNQPLEFSSAQGRTITPASARTDDAGRATITVADVQDGDMIEATAFDGGDQRPASCRNRAGRGTGSGGGRGPAGAGNQRSQLHSDRQQRHGDHHGTGHQCTQPGGGRRERRVQCQRWRAAHRRQ